MDELSLSINYTRANTDGTATEAEFLVDGATGTTVQMGGEGQVSDDALALVAGFAAVLHTGIDEP